MSSKWSQNEHTLTLNVKWLNLNTFITTILALKKKQAKKHASKLEALSSRRVSSSSIEDDDEEAEDEVQASLTQRNALVDISKCIFIIICITKFNKKEFMLDIKIIHLDEFKIHDYNAMIIKIMHKEAERVKIDFKQKFTIIIIFELRLKKCLKTIFDSSNWKNLKKNIKEYIKTKFKNLYIDYIIIFVKIYKHDNND